MKTSFNGFIFLLVIALFSGCGTSNFYKQKYTNLNQPKTEYFEQDHKKTLLAEEESINKLNEEHPLIAHDEVSPTEAISENNNLDSYTDSVYINDFSKNQPYDISPSNEITTENIKGKGTSVQEEENYFPWFFWLCLLIFLTATLFMVMGFWIFFSAMAAGTLAASQSTILLYLLMAGLIFGVFYFLNILGIEVWFFGTLSYYFILAILLVPIISLGGFLLWEFLFG